MADSTTDQVLPISIRISRELRRRIGVSAKEYGRSLPAEIIQSLERSYPNSIGLIAFVRVYEKNILNSGFDVKDVREHSEELFIRPNVGAGSTFDVRGFVRTIDGKIFMRVKCLP
ncbi:hypothetical protein ACOTTU_10075 [Roseobacter sp. EG26]|uniref:hypothetical protein n=1 Tax=Roseobacter sp. EG26 TaxID=3412477 RepID=UPI003CE47165